MMNLPELADRSKEQQRHARDLEVRLSFKYGAAMFPWPLQGLQVTLGRLGKGIRLALLLRLAWSLAASADPSEDEYCPFAEHLCRC